MIDHFLGRVTFFTFMRLYLSIVLLALLAACGNRQETTAASAPQDTVSLEQARQWGVAAAGAIAVSDHSDTLDLQRSIVDAHATRSQLTMAGNDEAAQAFDEALRDELRRVDPQVAQELFPDKK